MSTSPQKLPPRPGARKKAKAEKNKAGRSPKERLIVWTAIAVLAVIVVLEARAKFQHSAAVRAIDRVQRESGGKPVKFDQIAPLIGGQPTIASQVVGNEKRKLEFKIYTWRWSGIFRTYTIELHVDEDGEISGR